MSYARWSSDDHTCDVYVYASDAGWITHVAARRYVPCRPLPEPVPLDPDHAEQWAARHVLLSAILDYSPLVPIGLPHDGATFTDPDPGACAKTLTRLAAAGYRVPQYAIDALRGEADDGP